MTDSQHNFDEHIRSIKAEYDALHDDNFIHAGHALVKLLESGVKTARAIELVVSSYAHIHDSCMRHYLSDIVSRHHAGGVTISSI